MSGSQHPSSKERQEAAPGERKRKPLGSGSGVAGSVGGRRAEEKKARLRAKSPGPPSQPRLSPSEGSTRRLPRGPCPPGSRQGGRGAGCPMEALPKPWAPVLALRFMGCASSGRYSLAPKFVFFHVENGNADSIHWEGR